MKKGYRNLLFIFILFGIMGCGLMSKATQKPIISEKADTGIEFYKVPEISENLSLDTDGDGVQNYKDKCPNTAAGEPVEENGCSNEGNGYSNTAISSITRKFAKEINFGFNKSKINQNGLPLLDKLTLSLKSKPEIDIEIQGHTDSKGDKAYNKRLSMARANAVKEYLVGKGISRSRIVSQGYGSERPIASNKTADGRALNRRVEAIPII